MFTFADAKRYLMWALLTVVAVAAMIYVVDYGWFRLREARTGNDGPVSSVTVYYSTTLKNGKEELFYSNPQILPCAQSLFPHEGYTPCWYLERSPVRPIG